jgi:prolyl-tRNA synthetase
LLSDEIANKYRDELRPRHGLLRTKEFLMKDLYSFDSSSAGALETYINVLTAYKNLFVDLGVPFLVSEASSGDIGGPMSHEFHFESELGEDVVWTCNSCNYSANDEVADRRQTDQAKPLSEDVKVWYGVSKDKATKVAFVYPGKKDTPSTLADLNLRIVKQLYPELDTAIDERSTRDLKTNFTVVIRHPQVTAGVDIWGSSEENTGEVASSVDVDFTSIQPDDPCPRCDSGKLSKHRTIEVGHTFYLGTKYSLPLGVAIKRGDSKIKDPLHMGCYGIGVSRIIGAIARQHSSTKQLANEGPGIHWPATVAPYDVLVLPNGYLEERSGALEIYDKLTSSSDGGGGVSALIDDRRESLGYRFTDADLRGFPVLVVLGKRWPDAAEVQHRAAPLRKREHRMVPRAEVPRVAAQLLREARERARSAAAASMGPAQIAAMLAKLEATLEEADKRQAEAEAEGALPEEPASVDKDGGRSVT